MTNPSLIWFQAQVRDRASAYNAYQLTTPFVGHSISDRNLVIIPSAGGTGRNVILTRPQQENALGHAWASALSAYEFGTARAGVMGFGNEWVLEFGSNIERYMSGNLYDRWSDAHNNEIGRMIGAYVRDRNLPVQAIDYLVRYALEQGSLTGLIRDPSTNQVVGFSNIPAANGSNAELTLAMLDAAVASAGYAAFAQSPTVFASDFHALVNTPEGRLALEYLGRRLDDALRRAIEGIDINPLPDRSPFEFPPSFPFLRPFTFSLNNGLTPLVGICDAPVLTRTSARTFTLVEQIDYGDGRIEIVTRQFASDTDLPAQIDPYALPSGVRITSLVETRNFSGSTVTSTATIADGKPSGVTTAYSFNGGAAVLTVNQKFDANGVVQSTASTFTGDAGALTTLDSAQSMPVADLAQAFGSTLGRQLAGDNLLLGTLTGSLLGTIGLNIGQAIEAGINGTLTSITLPDGTLKEIKAEASSVWANFANELQEFTANAAIGSVSSWLALELGEKLGLEGFGAEMFSTGVGALLEHTLTDLAQDAGLLHSVKPQASWFKQGNLTTTGVDVLASALAVNFFAHATEEARRASL